MKFKSTSKMIDRETANKEIKQNISLSNTEKSLIKEQMDFVNPKVQNAFKNYTESKFNAFLFPIEDIMRFIKEDPKNPNSGKSDYLMVILGAHLADSEQFQEGTQTVIITGVNQVDSNDNQSPRFVTLNIPYPAEEYPPQLILSSLPGSNFHSDSNSIEFTIS